MNPTSMQIRDCLFETAGLSLKNFPRVVSLPLILVESAIGILALEAYLIVPTIYHTAMMALNGLATVLTLAQWGTAKNNLRYHAFQAAHDGIGVVAVPIIVTVFAIVVIFKGLFSPEEQANKLINAVKENK